MPGPIILYVPPPSAGKCVGCEATKRKLAQLGFDWVERNVEDYPDEAEALASKVGRQAPLVAAGGQVWSGYRPDLISKLGA